MKKMSKKVVKLVVATLAMVMLLSMTAFAASCKNPTLLVTTGLRGSSCGEYNHGAVVIYLHKGHKLTEVKVDGKKVSLPKKKQSASQCPTCGAEREVYRLELKKGTYKIEVKDDLGYWITDYVTVKGKTCNKDHKTWDYNTLPGWRFE